MTVPTTPSGQVAAELYEAVRPLAYDDPARGYATLIVCNAFGETLEDLSSIVDPDPDTAVLGWQAVMSPTTAPVAWLKWLGQFVGVRIPAGIDEASARLRIAETDGFRRGSLGAIMGAARSYLIGDRKVVLRERYDPSDPLVDSPYHLTVFTFDDETPDPAAVERAIVAQKPAGILLHYEVREGQDYATLATVGTYGDLTTTYPTYGDIAGTY